MGYRESARQVNDVQARLGLSSAVGEYMEAKAAELLGYDVSSKANRFVFGDSSDLFKEVQQAGFDILLPVYSGSEPGVYRAEQLPHIIYYYDNYTQLSGLVPDQHIDFLSELESLYRERIFPLGLLSNKLKFGVNKLLQAGFPVVMVESSAWGPADSSGNQIARLMQAARSSYDSENVEDGEKLIRAGKRDMAFWASLKGVVESIRDVPANVTAASFKFGLNNIVPITIAAVVIIGVIAAKNKALGLKFSTK